MKEVTIRITENDKGAMLANATVTVEGEQVYTWNAAVDRTADREESSYQVGRLVLDAVKAFEEA